MAAKKLFILLIVVFMSAACTPSPFQPITPENIADIELGYAVPGYCMFGGINPDGQWLASNNFYGSNNRIYDLATGVEYFALPSTVSYSPDGQWVLFNGNGLYSYPSMHHKMTLPAQTYAHFSPDSKYVFVRGMGVYEIETLTHVIPTEGEYARFSPQGTYISIDDDGLYEIETGQRIAEDNNPREWYQDSFSPNEQWVFRNYGGLYRLPSYEQMWEVSESAYGLDYSSDGQYIAVDTLGILEVETGEMVIPNFTLGAAFTSDSSQVVLSDGIYNLPSGEKVVSFSATTIDLSSSEKFVFSEAGVFDFVTGERIELVGNAYSVSTFDEDRYMLEGNRIYDTNDWQLVTEVMPERLTYPLVSEQGNLVTNLHSGRDTNTGASCLIYGVEGNRWPYRSGVVRSEADVVLYETPQAVEQLAYVSGEMIVYAQTEDQQWFKVLRDTERIEYGWIHAADIEPVFMPEGIPVEDGL